MSTAASGQDPMLRWLPAPQPVLVNPQAVLVLPRRWPRASERPLGVMAGAIDLRLDQQWIPATLYRWLRVHLNFWICEIEIVYTSRNGARTVPIRQWVTEEAVRLPDNRTPGR